MRKNLNYENVALWGVVFLVISTLTAKKVITLVSSKSQFKTMLRPIANQLRQVFGINPDLVISQAALESGWGASGLTKQDNNLFGMTAGADWIKFHTGKLALDKIPKWTVLGDGRKVAWWPTNEHANTTPDKISYWEIPGDVLEKKADGKGGTDLKVKRAFRSYRDWGESVADWGKKIATMPRYSAAFAAAKNGNVKEFAAALQTAGYATDPNYADKVAKFAAVVKDIPEATA